MTKNDESHDDKIDRDRRMLLQSMAGLATLAGTTSLVETGTAAHERMKQADLYQMPEYDSKAIHLQARAQTLHLLRNQGLSEAELAKAKQFLVKYQDLRDQYPDGQDITKRDAALAGLLAQAQMKDKTSAPIRQIRLYQEQVGKLTQASAGRVAQVERKHEKTERRFTRAKGEAAVGAGIGLGVVLKILDDRQASYQAKREAELKQNSKSTQGMARD